MRIAISSWSRRKVGGLESYLSGLTPELVRAGHSVAFWHEVDAPSTRKEIELPAGVSTWCASEIGAQGALAALSGWGPEVIYAHGLLDPHLEGRTLSIAPAVFHAHAYYGTCISGLKTFKSPVVTPCGRRFGWQCLLHYYPRRCGGWSPLTMLREYRRQAKRLAVLRRYRAIVTLSEHMRLEYVRHGFPPDRVHNLCRDGAPVPVNRDSPAGVRSHSLWAPGAAEPMGRGTERDHCWRILFLGRMERLKGGRTLLDALPRVRASLDRPVCVTFAGEGRERPIWEGRAARVRARAPGLNIEFVGWVEGPQLHGLLADCDLLVLPSLWPEPFGLAGVEAGLYGVPAAAFAVGGIPGWLIDGVSGHLAPGSPPSAVGLAEAIVKCLRDPATHARLRRGAKEMAQRFSVRTHVAALLTIFEKVLERG